MTNTKNTDEDGKHVIIAIIIFVLALAAFLIPNPPDEIPALELDSKPVGMVHKAYAANHLVDTDEMVVEKPVKNSTPELHPNLKVICKCESAGHPHKDSEGVLLSGYVDSDHKGS
jgi:hypothetical protein